MSDLVSKMLLKNRPILYGIILAMVLALIGINPVQADSEDNVVELSTDGTTYTSSITDLFGPVTLVPLDDVEKSFWVRNGGLTDAYLSIALVKVEVPSAVAAHSLSISAAVDNEAEAYYSLDTQNECLNINSGQLLAPGEATLINTNLWMGDIDDQEGQNVPVGFSLQVTLSEGIPSNAGQPCGFAPGPTPVPTQPTPTSPTAAPSSSKNATASHGANQNYKGNSLARTGASTLLILLAASVIITGGVFTVGHLRKKYQHETSE